LNGHEKGAKEREREKEGGIERVPLFENNARCTADRVYVP